MINYLERLGDIETSRVLFFSGVFDLYKIISYNTIL